MVWIWEVAYAARLSVDIAGAFVVVVGGGVDVAAVDAAAAGVDDVVDDDQVVRFCYVCGGI